MKAWRDCRVLVLGLGLTGFSLARYLLRHGADVRVADTRTEPPYATRLSEAWPQVKIHRGALTADLFDGIDMIAISPGVPQEQPLIQQAVARGVALVGDVELFARALPMQQKVLAITGTNGKTTTTELTRTLCAAAGLRTVAAGNIGDAVLDVLERFENGGTGEAWPDVFVLELSSYQLETTTSLRPAAATVLNVSENHLDRYDDVAAYARAKAMIFHGALQQILNNEDAQVMAMRIHAVPLQMFGAKQKTQQQTALTPQAATQWLLQEHEGAMWLTCDGAPLLPMAELTLAGRHNALNALAALALTASVGEINARVLEALRQFRGLPHRMEEVATVNGVRYINDSKATTVTATQAALDGMVRPVVLIAGGDAKGQDFVPLASTVAQYCRAVLLIGRDAPQIEQALAPSGATVEMCGTLDKAVARAQVLAQTGDIVLLSPACASLDQFTDYMARGRCFAEQVLGSAVVSSNGGAR